MNEAPPPKPPPAADFDCAVPGEATSLRIAALRSYGVLDTPREQAFDDITGLAGMICQAPIAVVNLIDQDRQWFKSEIGLGVSETNLDVSICAHAIVQHDLFIVSDLREDARFSNNPLVTGEPFLRFYAGALLKTPDGLVLGTLCVLDHQPRQLVPAQIDALQALAGQTMAQLELRRMLVQSQASNDYRRRLMAIAGHDLKTPIRTASYAIRKVQRAATSDQSATLDLACEALSTIDREFSQLATMASVGGTATTPDLIEFDLSDVLNPILANWRTPADRKSLRLRSVPTRLRVRSHPALLATLLGNLVGNAVKYTSSGSVLVGCRRRGNQVTVEVVDTGSGMEGLEGMENEISGDLFDAFHQVNPSSEGLGLGLWIVRGTAKSLGHSLRVHSRAGSGTRFSVEMSRA